MAIRPLPLVLAEKAKNELNENPKRVAEDIQHIKDWLAKQRHLKARTDDQWLLVFLRGCKFSLEKTKEKLDLYYSIKTTAPEFFIVKYNSKMFNEIINLRTILVLPKVANADDPVTILMRPGKYNPDVYKITDAMCANNIIIKILLLENDNAVVSGIRTIVDLEGVTMGHFLQMTPLTMKKMVVVAQDAAPTRLKGVHFLNTPPGFETVFNALKAFVNQKNKNRFYVHNKNNDALHEHVPKDILPAEYGGYGGSEDEIIEYWRQKVQEYASWLEEDEQYGSDESKRPGKPRTAEAMFGLEGSFKRLEFD